MNQENLKKAVENIQVHFEENVNMQIEQIQHITQKLSDNI
jgi:sensor domain CHASE-containing protein